MTETVLTRLTGEVSCLHITMKPFDFSGDNLANKTGTAAIFASLAGAAASAAIMTSVTNQLRQPMAYFRCIVKGVTLTGCFERVTFENGEEIEFVVEYDPDNPRAAKVHAARNTHRKIVWVRPYHSFGEQAFRRSSFKGACFMGVGVFLFTFILCCIFSAINDNFFSPLFWEACIAAVLGGIASTLLCLACRGYDIKAAKRATQVFAVLGYKNPDDVDIVANRLDMYLENLIPKDHGEFISSWVSFYRDSDLDK